MREVTTYEDRSQPLIECTAVQKHYPDFALDITLTVPENTIVGLVGLNGSGKTTLFRLLTGLAKADAGSCRMLGQAADSLSVSMKEQIGVVLADTGFPAVFTPRDVKKVLAAFYTQFDPAYFDALVKRFAIPSDKAIEIFSTGMKARLRVIAAISHHPRILLLDEPTAGLDVAARNQILDLLREYMETPGRSILISSHIASDLENLCDSFQLISRGRILLAEDMDVLRDEYGYVKVPASQAATLDLAGVVCRKTNPDGSVEALVSDRQFYLDNYPHVLVERGGVDEALLLFEGADVVFDRDPHLREARKENNRS
ncbi:ABC transporter ATP-binding protein [Faecalibaculum rodentium]|jgi:ABC-2 type transport system ATP-binding protein|uniref:ABC transporter ATP-binding protein n=1 Tax=Faecalibaculum rodentium TaxID=1702221 RepID=UPI00248C03EB|nr:ABC transporter ATP-binding protein [Faecalibaculum rodentium]